MVSLDSVMETAFPPEDPEIYLANPRFQRLGTLRNWDYEPTACALSCGCRATEVEQPEHLEMLQIRDQLAELESTLTSEEQNALAEADRVLVERASAFHQEPLRLLDLLHTAGNAASYPARWWWYSDVISHLPRLKDEAPDMGHPTPHRL